MLVLSRKRQQDILIGDDIKITVLKVKGNTVRLGIEAPRNLRVVRGELPRDEDDEQFANVTVVFSDKVETDKSDGSRTVQWLPFPNQCPNQSSNHSCSISYRQRTPAALQHNRLRQIVRQVNARVSSPSDQ